MKKLRRIFSLWPTLRLALLPFILYLVGQYLEGPAYSAIVRSAPFVFVSSGITILAVQYMTEHSGWSFKMILPPSLLLPAAFVYSMQQQFDGGVKTLFSFDAFVTSMLMMLCGLVYLRSLAPARGTSSPRISETEQHSVDEVNDVGMHDIDSPRPEHGVVHYDIQLFQLDGEGRRSFLKQQQSGGYDLEKALLLDGYSRTLCIDLEPHWDIVLERRLTHYRTRVATYETIVKFDDTRQLVNEYELVFSVRFADDHP